MCAVFLLDAQFLVDAAKFVSGSLTALSTMVNLEIPHINILTKMDLLNKSAKKHIDRWVHSRNGKVCVSSKGLFPSRGLSTLEKFTDFIIWRLTMSHT